MSNTTPSPRSFRPPGSADLARAHASHALAHALSAHELGAKVPDELGRPIVGMFRAAAVLLSISSDPAAACDYGPTATADEILRSVFGAMATANLRRGVRPALPLPVGILGESRPATPPESVAAMTDPHTSPVEDAEALIALLATAREVAQRLMFHAPEATGFAHTASEIQRLKLGVIALAREVL